MKKELIAKLHKSFEECAHKSDQGTNGVEFWLARELQELLGYTQWRNFEAVIDKAKVACEKAGQAVADHFADVSKMVEIGSQTERPVADMMLTRYACYLVAQNGDPRKDAIAFAMTYFAVQTRKQEMIEARMAEWERVQAREKLTLSQKELSGVLYERGIDSQGFGRILSKGDAALFGGVTTQGMKNRLAVPEGRPLADFLPTITIKAKDFANEITNTQVKQQNLAGEANITQEHVKNNRDVRKLLTDRQIVPEQLPAAEDVKKLERRLKSEEKKLPAQTTRLVAKSVGKASKKTGSK
jgi:DNA-damage-inducible protein D